MKNCQATYNKDSSIPLGTENENSESDAELLEEETEDAKIDADTQASGSLEDSTEQLDEVTHAFTGDSESNQYLWALVEKQAQEVETLGVSVILPEIGAEVAPHRHRVIRTRPSDKPEGTILSVAHVGLEDENVDSRDADVITSSGSASD